MFRRLDLPDPTRRPVDRETRRRRALWIAAHLGIGGLVIFGLISVVPMPLIFVAQQPRYGTGALRCA